MLPSLTAKPGQRVQVYSSQPGEAWPVTIGETISTPRRDIANRTELFKFLLIFLADVLSARTIDKIVRSRYRILRSSAREFLPCWLGNHHTPGVGPKTSKFASKETDFHRDWCGGG
jgi:hypothetical protein